MNSQNLIMSDHNSLPVHYRFMQQALQLAQQAFNDEEVPVGALVVCDGMVVGRGYNQVEKFKDPTAHAEIIAITAACDSLKRKYLHNCTLYVTLEPCVMCTGALVNSKIDRVVFGAMDAKGGACGSIYNACDDDRLNHKIEIISGIMEDECSSIMTKFFKMRRRNGQD